MIVIGYVYNNNGMASWCIEAALALKRKGHEVLVIASSSMPKSSEVDFFYFDIKDESRGIKFWKKMSARLRRMVNCIPFLYRESDFLNKLDASLKKHDYKVDCYLLNQSNLFNTRVSINQVVVAWADRPFLVDYLRRVLLVNRSFKERFLALYDALYWYNSDWYAYKKAFSVFAVTDSLRRNIATKINHVHTVYPPFIRRSDIVTRKNYSSGKIRICFFALDIEDDRKGYLKLIEYLYDSNIKEQIHIDLIGQVSSRFVQLLNHNQLEFTSHGKLPRENAIEVVKNVDILVFASLIDDWGFVQVEAMSYGVIVLAPNVNPSVEIVGLKELLYECSNKESFLNKLQYAILALKNNTFLKDELLLRYDLLFNGNDFVNRIEKTILSK